MKINQIEIKFVQLKQLNKLMISRISEKINSPKKNQFESFQRIILLNVS